MTHPDTPGQNILPLLPYYPDDTWPPDPAPDAWLTHFPPDKRGLVAGQFHHYAQQGIMPAQLLVDLLQTEADAQAATQDWHPLMRAWIKDDRPGAELYARHVIAYEHLPHSERQQIKRRRATERRLRAVIRKEHA